MMQRNTLSSHLTDEFTIFRVLEIAHILDRVDMMTTPRDMILEDLWGSGKASAYDALMLGEDINDKMIIGTAYYQILVSKSRKWIDDGRLNERHRRHLEYGNHRCIAESLSMLQLWGRWAIEQHPTSTLRYHHSRSEYPPSLLGPDHRWLHLMLTGMAEDDCAPGDVVRRYEMALQVAPRASARVSVWSTVSSLTGNQERLEEALKQFKTNIYSYFVQPGLD